MSNLSNDTGRAYEYICLLTLEHEISVYRKVSVNHNSSYLAAQRAWNNIDPQMQALLSTSAEAVVNTIFDMEPLITEDGNDCLDLMIQTDDNGIAGDVRDILIIRRNIAWEIGLSLKHNHFAVKHSRLSGTIDFGERWFHVPCSQKYWSDVNPIFAYLSDARAQNLGWRDLPNKNGDVYRPLLTAFVDEIRRSYAAHREIPRRMVEYLLGEFDFYKIISVDARRTTRIEGFNLHGTLNKPGLRQKAKISVPVIALPTRIVSLDFKPDSSNTVEMYLDNGWQFSFRIHNASTAVEPSLKFDIQMIGMPTTILSIDCHWH